MPMGGETSQMGGGMGGGGGAPLGGAGPGGANSFKTPEACRYGPELLVETRVAPAVAQTLGLAPSRGPVSWLRGWNGSGP